MMRDMAYRVPAWVRAFLAMDRLGARLTNVREGLRDELLLAWTRPEDRAELTAALYANQGTYLPDGHRFKSGLFSWEKRVLDGAEFPKKGLVLLGAAGAGRELVALSERGHDVVAFDPCERFVEAARSVAPRDRATVVQASYEDLVAASQGRSNRLAEVLAGKRFDAVILGWGSLSHVSPAEARLELLRAVHTIAPHAPVLVSFAMQGETPVPLKSKGRVRDTFRALFALMGAPGRSEPGDHFYPETGFLCSIHPDEIDAHAWQTGYEVALLEDSPYPHAVLVPMDGGGVGKVAAA